MGNKTIIVEFWHYLIKHKAWWFAPIIAALLVIGLLIVFGQSNVTLPFIYALF
ncbi:MAG: hypothetical protein KJ709_04910 [Nanoarchaeota archaeon]|nr:hypothetical protein [Nanoarchaeota archaeon]